MVHHGPFFSVACPMAGHIEVYDLPLFRPRFLPDINPDDVPQMVEHYQDAQGRSKVKGGRGLKGSQAYPVQFLEPQSGRKHFHYCLIPPSW